MHNRHIIIPMFIPHKGCPFDCIYCNQKLISGQINDVSEQQMREIIDEHLSTIPEKATVEIGFYGGSFTGISREIQLRYLEIADEYVKNGSVTEVRLSTRPDYINEDILDYLKRYHVKTIELGVQSLDEEVLQKSRRGHSIDDVYKASGLIRDSGINLGIQTMVGLPGDSYEKDIDTAEKVIGLSPKIVRIYPTLVIRGTFLEKMYYSGKYRPLDLEEAVNLCAELLRMYESQKINVIRIGLQPTENISEGMDVVAGPFHPSFRHLVESKLILNTIENYIGDKGLANAGSITIFTGSRYISEVIGMKRCNIEYLKQKFGYKTISVKGDGTLGRNIKVEQAVE